ncbi:MAG: methyltransferase domain-containing protein [Prevotellaceae bacterium]|jgi:ubiquinone/menaquinone biosynthesis C-methylase UbiE|nr:methyltransferase domain-containing protein [Prevotellaceae bacterium]
MKFKYLRELLGYGQNYCCNGYSCSEFADAGENMPDERISVSKYNIPFDFIEINKGSVVVNIISNLGYEILKASEKTGKNGKVIGVDFSPAMMYKARYNVEKNGCRNVFFREVFSSKFLPVGANISDILIFNNLLTRFPNNNLLSEIYRTLKPGGVFYIYDTISEYMNCLKADIYSKADYIGNLTACGFKNIVIKEFIENATDSNPNVKSTNIALIRGEK